MTTSEVKARAIFGFLAEGPTELNLTAGEIVIITSGTDGSDWWFAQNSSGQSGAIPASYVELIKDESNIVQETSDNDTNLTASITNYQPRLEEEVRESLPTNIIEQSNETTEKDFSPDSSFDSLSSSTANNNLTGTRTETVNSLDPYKTILDPLTSTSTSEQQNSLLGDLVLSSSAVKSDDAYDTPSSALIPITTNETAPVQSTNNVNIDNSSASTTNKTKPEKTKLFTMKRSKTKSETEKRRESIENGLDASTRSKDDSDSDGLSDSGFSHNTLSTSNKHLSGGGDSKTTSRTKFFDKHGVGNYLLHECKTKPDEHVEIAFNESDGGICWLSNPNIPPFTCKIENPSKGTKFSGLKSFVEYKIHPQIPESRVVCRRYKQFDWLHEQLVAKYRFICIPPLPEKQIAGRFEQEFIEERRRQLELWLNRICHHPVLCASFPVQHFITCELTEKNNKDWKAGKRKVEKDEFRESSWLYCVIFGDSELSELQIASQIDLFAVQQPGLETHLKNLNQGFSKYLERHAEIYEHDINRVGDLFTKLHVVVKTDTTTPGNDDLSNSMSKISHSYNGIAELYKTKGYDSIRDFTERIQDYIGLLACFPIIINIQRSAAEYMRNVQQKGTISSSDLSGAMYRNQVLNHVVLAEINYFQKEKVNDLKLYMKSFLKQQIDFYQKITSELHDAVITFN